MAITDFLCWLDCNDLTDYNDVYSLYSSVNDIGEYAGFKTEKGNKAGSRIVHSIECDDDLFLASNLAVNAFLNLIRNKYCNGMDIEAYYAMERSKEKDD